MLRDFERRRFARHLLLPEIGETGQQRLCAARFALDAASDARAAAWAREYLERAGATVGEDGDSRLSPGGATRVEHLAGQPELREAAAALCGAFAAVEAIKRTAQVGQAASLPPDFTLTGDDP